MVDPAAEAVHTRFWTHLQSRRAPHQLVVISQDYSWEIPHNIAMMKSLLKFPPSFVRSVVFLTFEDGTRTSRELTFLRDAKARPTLLVVPFAVLTTNTHDPSAEPSARPFAVMQTGRPNNPSRRGLYVQLLAAGAVCRGPSATSFDVSTLCRNKTSESCRKWRECSPRRCEVLDEYQGLDCVLCAQPGAAACRARLMAASFRQWPDNSNGHVHVDIALHSTFCLEPHSDSAVRSHFYLVVQAGCIPVLFDMLHNPGPFPSPQEIPWAWRPPHLPELRAVLERSHRGRQALHSLEQFDRFALVYNVSLAHIFEDFVASEAPSLEAGWAHDDGPDHSWAAAEGRLVAGVVTHLAELADSQSPSRHQLLVRQLQKEVGRVAPLFRYALKPCESFEVATVRSPAPCDAFTMMTAQLEAIALHLGAGRGER